MNVSPNGGELVGTFGALGGGPGPDRLLLHPDEPSGMASPDTVTPPPQYVREV